MKKQPNFFIVGAPKCGTTALSEYLKEHPNVFITNPKEPHYFASDMVFHREIESGDAYLALFNEVMSEHIAVGEASVWYLYSKKAIKNIYEFDKKSKVIVMLRKPVDMVYSMHSQHMFSLGEDVIDFEKAWDLEYERKQGRSIPKHVLHVPNLYYSEIASYHKQLINLYSFFQKEQVKIILFDDFIDKTEEVYNEVLEFLNLPILERKAFPKVNESKVIRSNFIKKCFNKESSFGHKFRIELKKRLGINSIGFRAFLKKHNSMQNKRKPLNSIIRKRVINHYQSEVNQLSDLLGKDLSSWNKL